MTRADALRSIRKAAELLTTRPMVKVPDRTLMAETLTNAANTFEDAELRGGFTPEYTWEHVDRLRAEARKARGMPGLHFRTNFFDELADILQVALRPRGN